jgi:hypothetical protein
MPRTAARSRIAAPTIRSWRRRASGYGVVLLLLVAAATACAAPADPVADPMPADAPGPAASTPPDGTDDLVPREAPSVTPDERVVACGDAVAELDAVISEQLAAFAAGDWDHAFSLTSREFRAGGIDARTLREIVVLGYPEAADAARHEVLGCVRSADEAQVLIEVTARDGATLGLVYLLTREDGRWRISGAVEHEVSSSEPATIRT